MPHSTTEDENRFDKLVIALRDALASSGPLASDIDESTLTRLMQNYQSKETEWSRFAFADPERAYTRNLVDKGNGKSNLVSTALVLSSLATWINPTACPRLEPRPRKSCT